MRIGYLLGFFFNHEPIYSPNNITSLISIVSPRCSRIFRPSMVFALYVIAKDEERRNSFFSLLWFNFFKKVNQKNGKLKMEHNRNNNNDINNINGQTPMQ